MEAGCIGTCPFACGRYCVVIAPIALQRDRMIGVEHPPTGNRQFHIGRCQFNAARNAALIREGLAEGLRRDAPRFALKLLKLPERVQTKCKPEGPRFAPKSLNSHRRGANCNPYFRPGASDVARVCSPHTISPGRNHAIEIGTGFSRRETTQARRAYRTFSTCRRYSELDLHAAMGRIVTQHQHDNSPDCAALQASREIC